MAWRVRVLAAFTTERWSRRCSDAAYCREVAFVRLAAPRDGSVVTVRESGAVSPARRMSFDVPLSRLRRRRALPRGEPALEQDPVVTWSIRTGRLNHCE